MDLDALERIRQEEIDHADERLHEMENLTANSDDPGGSMDPSYTQEYAEAPQPQVYQRESSFRSVFDKIREIFTIETKSEPLEKYKEHIINREHEEDVAMMIRSGEAMIGVNTLNLAWVEFLTGLWRLLNRKGVVSWFVARMRAKNATRGAA